MKLEQQVQEKRNLLRADRLDMSFGEIMSNYEEGNLIIQPLYQRSFRWDEYRRTRFIESILLGIPIPPIFVAEDDEGKWELVDGLQRISTILSFFGCLKDSNKNKFSLVEGEILTELKDKNIDNLPSKLQLTIKRYVCRVEILRWDTESNIKYQLFSRLNTGGEPLTEQELRNCIYKGELNDIINELAKYENFIKIIIPTDRQKEEMYLSELVLRFFAFYYKHNDLILSKGGSIQAFLADFMLSKMNLPAENFNDVKNTFTQCVEFLSSNELADIFRDNKARKFNINHYDTIMFILSNQINSSLPIDAKEFKHKIKILLDNDEYKNASGSSTYATKRMQEKIKVAEKLFNEIE